MNVKKAKKLRKRLNEYCKSVPMAEDVKKAIFKDMKRNADKYL